MSQLIKDIIQGLLDGTIQVIQDKIDQVNGSSLNISDITLPRIENVILDLKNGIESENEQIAQKSKTIAKQIIQYENQVDAVTDTIYKQYLNKEQVIQGIREIIKKYTDLAEQCINYPKSGQIRKSCVLSSLHTYLMNSCAKEYYNVLLENIIDELIDKICEKYDHSVEQVVKGCVMCSARKASVKKEKKAKTTEKEDKPKEK